MKSFPIVGILGLIFITLKLTGTITWSWVWVLAPFWLGLAVVVLMGTFCLLVFAAAILAKAITGR